VTRPHIRAPIPHLAPGDRSIAGATAHYLARVLRLRANDAFVAFDPAEGDEADAVVIHTDGESMDVRFGPLRSGRVLPARGILWIQGFAKADKCDTIVRDATELGATRIVIARTSRSIVRLDDARAAARQTRWTRIAQEAARQCGRSDAPAVDPLKPWNDAIASVGTDSGANVGAAVDAGADVDASALFCLWEHATEPLGPALFEALAQGRPLAFACGPEGGLEDAEVDFARARGWHAVSLGPLVLRTETVAGAVLGAVRVWSGLGG
jgi:16S rRNA (uracil1498-N3)-methyltransferase